MKLFPGLFPPQVALARLGSSIYYKLTVRFRLSNLSSSSQIVLSTVINSSSSNNIITKYHYHLISVLSNYTIYNLSI